MRERGGNKRERERGRERERERRDEVKEGNLFCFLKLNVSKDKMVHWGTLGFEVEKRNVVWGRKHKQE